MDCALIFPTGVLGNDNAALARECGLASIHQALAGWYDFVVARLESFGLRQLAQACTPARTSTTSQHVLIPHWKVILYQAAFRIGPHRREHPSKNPLLRPILHLPPNVDVTIVPANSVVAEIVLLNNKSTTRSHSIPAQTAIPRPLCLRSDQIEWLCYHLLSIGLTVHHLVSHFVCSCINNISSNQSVFKRTRKT